jgi:tetratricopeptide (TPR) repeat protein
MTLFADIPVLDFQSVSIAAGIALGLLLIFFLFMYRRDQSLAAYDFKLDLEDKSKRWIEKKAGELVRVEAFRLAGDLHAHIERWEEAAELYKKGGNLIRAAESYLAAGKSAEAAQAYMGSHDYNRAASLFLESKDYQRAAGACLKAGDSLKAAQTFERGGALEQAAKIYVEQGLYRQASETYARNEEWSRAADALWRCFGEELARLPEEVPAKNSMPLRLLARRAGEMFEKADRHEDAIEAYKTGGWIRESAAMLCDLSRFQEAADAYLEINDFLRAADCFESAGDGKQAASLKARHYLNKGQEAEAVPFLAAAGEYDRAADIHRKQEKWTLAGEAYEKAEKFREAAAMYEKANEYGPAAASLEKTGDFRAAADLYARAGNPSAQAEALDKAGDFLGAGANYFERGLLDKAIAVLQKVEPEAEEFSTASLLLGQTFKEKGMMDLALEYFRRSVADQDISRGNLENYYQLGVCMERIDKTEDAARVFEQILVVDYHFKDVADRLNAIKASQTVVETPSTPSAMEDTVSGQTIPGGNAQAVSVSQHERYTLLEEIGRGGMGIVYQARDNILERLVAFKVLPANLKDHPQALKNFFREAKSAARLNHPNIVTVFDAGEEGGTYYIAMEFVEGETIKNILSRETHLPIKGVLMIAGQVCRALEYAHDRRIVHRDIKSSNVMWTPDKQVKLMDFGLAKVIEEVKGYQTIASGTPYYMSPEQTLGRNIDHRTDIYSLGITIFEMATGKLPFMHGDAAYHHVHTPPPEANSINPDIPDELNQIILKCMQKKPEDRYPGAKELFMSLRHVVVQ